MLFCCLLSLAAVVEAGYYQQGARGDRSPHGTARRAVAGQADEKNQAQGDYAYSNSMGKPHLVEYPAGLNLFLPRIITETRQTEQNDTKPMADTRQNHEGTSYTINIDTKDFKHQQIRNHNGNVRGSYGYKNNGKIFQAIYNTGNDRPNVKNQQLLNRAIIHNDNSFKPVESKIKIKTTQECYKCSYSDVESKNGNEYHDNFDINTYTYSDESSGSTRKDNNNQQLTKQTMEELNNSKVNWIHNGRKQLPGYDSFLLKNNTEVFGENTKNASVVKQVDIIHPSTRNDHETIKVPNLSSEFEKQLRDEDYNTEPDELVDASYKFGFSVDGQSRHEESDSNGNVKGNYSYIGSDGLLNMVEYEAGAGIGFVVKQITQKELKPEKNLQSLNIETQNHSISPDNKESNEQTTSLESDMENKNVYVGTDLDSSPSDVHFNKPASLEVVLDVADIRRATAVPDSGDNDRRTSFMRRKLFKRPLNVAATKSKSQILSDGSYVLSYKTGDHSRQESVDSRGNIHSDYQFQTKENNGKTVLVSVKKTIIDPSTKYFDDDKNASVNSRDHLPAKFQEKDKFYSSSNTVPNNSRSSLSNRKRSMRRLVNTAQTRGRKIFGRTAPQNYNNSYHLFLPQIMHELRNSKTTRMSTEVNDNHADISESTTNGETVFETTRNISPALSVSSMTTAPFRGNVKYKRNYILPSSGMI